jgi:hypothetical protein
MVGPQTALSVGTGGPSYFRHSSVRACGSGVYSAGGTVFVQAAVIAGTWPERYGAGLSGTNVVTQPADSNDVEATVVSRFTFGVYGVPARNVVAAYCSEGFNYCRPVTYCTAVYNNYGFDECNIMNSIAVGNSRGAYRCGPVDYSNLWNNSQNMESCYNVGPYVAFFDPFFVNPTQGDFRLAANSVFKNFSSTGWEIGAYGPGNTPPVKSRNTSWGALKSLYR